MKVEIQSVKFDADKKLVDFIQAKMNKMDRFVENALSSQVTLKIDKDDEQGNKVAVVKIDVAGGELLAERRCKSFEEAIDLCLDAIKKQIDKYKEKRR
ncbi:MAG TPA: ribosome-associated translation inhibitor RaiA, partial [Candidatus Alistipes pullicola]|nr:ribosome-associated translation inhibitor RaiA [Candidatus Alistipes pullicola]